MKTFCAPDGLSAETINNNQNELLLATIDYARQMSPFYKDILQNAGTLQSAAHAREYLDKLPFTTKQDISNDNWNFLAVKKQDIAEFVSTSGTTGEPVFLALTENDLERLTCSEERNFNNINAGKGDLFHIVVTCDNLFTAGIAYYRGLLRRGASVARIGPKSIIRHFQLITELRPTGIVAVPSFMHYLIRHANETGINISDLGIEKIVLIGDSVRNADFSTNTLGSFIENSFGRKVFSAYGISEGQISFGECKFHQGLHGHMDFVYVEIVSDEGIPLQDGEIGEMVITTLQHEGMPLIRYKTGDITFKLSGLCLCGRNSVRIGPVLGRKHHRLKVKGVTLYPKTIENAIFHLNDVINYQLEAYTGDTKTDHIILRIGSHRNDDKFRSSLIDILRAKTRVVPEIEIASPNEIEKKLFEGGSRKAITFKDRRIKLHE